MHACCVLVTKLCVRTFRSLCHCDELLFLTKDSFLELGSLGLLSSFIKLTEKVSSSLALSRCRFETNKKLRLHAIILFAFARLKYIHTRTHARAQIEHNILNSFFGRARTSELILSKREEEDFKKGTVEDAKTTV